MGKVIVFAGGTVALLLSGGLYCCVVMGAREDRLMETLRKHAEESAGDEDG